MPKSVDGEYGKLFFDYDQIEFYKIDIEEDSELNLYDRKDLSKFDLLKYGVVIEEIPKDIKDQEFLKDMSRMGYKKKEIDSSKFKDFNKIFVEKPEALGSVAACIPVYRDILIFKKSKKVIGMVKICFSCHQYRILGANGSTMNFGSDEDYKKLWILLNKY